MRAFPPDLEKILLGHIKKTYLPARLSKGGGDFNSRDIQFFSKGAEILSDSFTVERGSRRVNYFNDPVLRSGYLLYFLPVNFLKVRRILSEFKPAELTSGKVRVLDVGAGPGTATLSVMSFYAEEARAGRMKGVWLDFTLIDQNFNILKDAKSLHDAYRKKLVSQRSNFESSCSVKNYDLRRGGLNRFLRNFRYHLILIHNLLNEFPSVADRVAFVEVLLRDHLEPKKGKIVIVEPSLRETSRDLQALRDELVLKKKVAFVHAPCLHQEACPLNVVNQRDWCHFYFDWKTPGFIEKVDRLIGNRKEFLSCSYLVLGREPRHVVQPPPLRGAGTALSERSESKGEGEGGDRKIWRVISNPLPSKGKDEIILCGPKGRYRLTRLERDAAKANIDFPRIARGDLVKVDVGSQGKAYDVDGSYQVKKGDVVRIVKRL